MTEPCYIQIEGIRLNETNRLRIELASDPCGEPSDEGFLQTLWARNSPEPNVTVRAEPRVTESARAHSQY